MAKNARAITETALGEGENALHERPAIKHSNTLDDGRDLLAVGADILNRRRTRGSRYSGEALDSCQLLPNRRGDDVIPGFAGGGCEHRAVVFARHIDAPIGDPDHHPANAPVGNHHVGSATQDRDRQIPVRGPPQRITQLFNGRGFDKPVGASAQLEGGSGCEGLVGHRFRHREQFTRDSPPDTRWEQGQKESDLRA